MTRIDFKVHDDSMNLEGEAKSFPDDSGQDILLRDSSRRVQEDDLLWYDLEEVFHERLSISDGLLDDTSMQAGNDDIAVVSVDDLDESLGDLDSLGPEELEVLGRRSCHKELIRLDIPMTEKSISDRLSHLSCAKKANLDSFQSEFLPWTPRS